MVHGQESHVWRLNKYLYRLKKEPRAWYLRSDNYLMRLGFTKSHADSNLYFKVFENHPLSLAWQIMPPLLRGSVHERETLVVILPTMPLIALGIPLVLSRMRLCEENGSLSCGRASLSCIRVKDLDCEWLGGDVAWPLPIPCHWVIEAMSSPQGPDHLLLDRTSP